MSGEIIRELAALGLSLEQVAGVMDIMERDAEARKEKARARLHKHREKKRSETLRNVSSALAGSDARGEDNLQTKKISGQEEKKDTSPPARSKRGERIPDDFQPDVQSAISEGLSRQEAERQARSFCDYWRAKPGKDGLKLDWQATWRVWYRRHLSSSPPPSRHSADPPHRMDRVNAILDEIQGKSHVPQHTGPSIDGSVERTDRSGAPNLVQLHAVSAWGRS